MIFFTNNININEKIKILENEKIILNNSINVFKVKKDLLLLCMKKITSYIECIDSIDEPDILDATLLNLKNILEKMHFNNDNLLLLKNILEKINIENTETYQYINEYNNLQHDIQNQLNNNYMDFELFIKEILENSHFELNKQNTNSTTFSIDNINIENTVENINNSQIDNNCLLISEKENKVFLPYKISDLESQLKSNDNQCTSIEELIQKKYIIPLEQFKFPTLSRFKMTYNLMKNKEKSSFLEAISLAIELSHNSLLNPAVIAACKSQDELDIYLDCLYENELDKFKIFDIKYDISPTKK